MRAITVAKYVVAGSGLFIFGIGIRYDSVSIRWAGIGVVAAAWLLRFVKEAPGARPLQRAGRRRSPTGGS